MMGILLHSMGVEWWAIEYIKWAITAIASFLMIAGSAPAVNHRSVNNALRLLKWMTEKMEPYLGTLPIYSLPSVAIGALVLWWIYG